MQKICNGILSVHHLLPPKIHHKIQHAEFAGNLTPEMLGVAEAGEGVFARDEEQRDKKTGQSVAV